MTADEKALVRDVYAQARAMLADRRLSSGQVALSGFDGMAFDRVAYLLAVAARYWRWRRGKEPVA